MPARQMMDAHEATPLYAGAGGSARGWHANFASLPGIAVIVAGLATLTA
jgi:hypothetical protein